MKPKLLDLFCGAGGCTKGYQLAGFYVVGVDIKNQPRYCGDEFFQMDAIEYLKKHGHKYDVIHASPPCQAYGKTKHLAGNHPKLIKEVRDLLIKTGKPYIIENVPGAPLNNPLLLNAAMFGMLVLRDRLFESNLPLPLVLLPQNPKPVKMGRPVSNGQVIQPVGNFSGIDYARKQMGIDWMTQKEIAQAIPPAYTEFIGKHIIKLI
jgi:DNA (cytosine-5)-methyltransferase 1